MQTDQIGQYGLGKPHIEPDCHRHPVAFCLGNIRDVSWQTAKFGMKTLDQCTLFEQLRC
jgi:hypothetical protein